MSEWMCKWTEKNKWAIVDVETDELIMTYEGSFLDVMKFVNKNYEVDDTIDVMAYEVWIAIANEQINRRTKALLALLNR